jgi:dTDP-4-amino-4,6-dideoxygalactose transaminase
MSNLQIPLSYNQVDPESIKAVLDQYRGRHHREIVADFESQIKSKTGAGHALALNTGTAAIHLALRLLGVGSGDEVLTSTFTYVATANPILYVGGVPVFIDSERETWNMDPDLLETAVKDRIKKGKKPKAILVVHCYGMPAMMSEIASISRQYEIPIIEDAAEALGSTIDGKHVGTFGAIGVLSFNNNKIVTTYGGGALLTNSDNFYKTAQFWASQSREDMLYYLHKEQGFNYSMSPLNAACGLSQLKDLQNKVDARRATYHAYKKNLMSDGVEFTEEKDGFFSNRWLTTVILKDEKVQSKASKELLGAGIEIRPVWNPMHKQPLFKDCKGYLNGVSDELFSRALCLPSHNGDEITALVADQLRLFLR